MTQYLAFAGNIGAGKSTHAQLVGRSLSTALVEEAVDDNPFLEQFYRAPNDWAFRLQMFNLADRAATILDALDRGSVVVDRSFEEDIVYVDAALASGFVSVDEHAVYVRLYSLLRRLLPVPTLLIYVAVTDIEELHRRITSRGRDIESAVTIEYLEDLQNRYEAWYQAYDGPKLRVDNSAASVESAAERIIGVVRG